MMPLGNRAHGARRWIKFAAGVLITLASMTWMAAPSVGESSDLDPKAQELLQAMSNHLGSAKTLGMRVSSTFDRVLESGIKLKIGIEQTVVLSRPGKLHASTRVDDGRKRMVWFEDGRLTIFTSADNAFAVVETPKDIDGMLDFMEDKYGIDYAVSDLLYSKPAETAEEFLLSSAYIGVRLVEGVPCHHLSLESRGADWQIWIKDGADPVPCRLVVTSVLQDERPELIATFRDVTVDAETPDKLFKFQVPSGAEELELSPVKHED